MKPPVSSPETVHTQTTAIRVVVSLGIIVVLATTTGPIVSLAIGLSLLLFGLQWAIELLSVQAQELGRIRSMMERQTPAEPPVVLR